MSVEGTWDLVIATPIGKQEAALELSIEEGYLRGIAKGQKEDVELTALKLVGVRLTWAQSITKPMRLNLVFDVTVDGDAMSGTAKAGRLPASRVTGRRRVKGRIVP
jgi:hypothetical protein